MKYENFQTFEATIANTTATVTFNFGSANVQGQEMLADLGGLAKRLTLKQPMTLSQNDHVRAPIMQRELA
ncbi:hypothetical protein RKLH11_2662 [Rhodobacteraceae bacterium KLH11]|nr:hypothetical protein RKLH11_2662 [Rhodobacteraceae bacterium KLH11]